MPRLTQSLPRMREHKPSGRARVTLSKKTFYLGPYGSKGAKKEYDKLIAEWLANGREHPPGIKQEAEAVTVSHLLAAYWRFAEGYYRKDGRATGELHPIKSALRFLRALYGKLAIAEFTPLKLQAARQSMIEAGLARSTINSHVQRIIRCFSWGTAQELVPGHLVHALREVPGLRRGRTVARESQPVLPVDDSIVQQTLPYLSPIVADMVRLQRLTGMRPAEVCAIRPGNVDLTQSVWVYSPDRHKTEHHGRARRIPIGPKAQAILLIYLQRDPDSYCFSPVESEAQRRAIATAERTTPATYGNRVGTNRKRSPRRSAGDHYTSATYRRAIERACDAAFGLPDHCQVPRDPTQIDPEERAARLQAARKWRAEHRWSPNQLRHSAATEIRAKFGLEAAQVMLGHSHAAVTEVYAERDLHKAIQVAAEVG